MKKIILATLLLAAMSAFADTTTTTATPPNCKDESHYPIVSKSDVQTLVQSKTATVFDVNGKDSYQKAHVPGAIDYVSNEKNFATLLPQDKNAPIVAYCGGPMCSAWKKAAERACSMGYTNIKHFKDGIAGWTKS
jgi:rhodanese-related sulfurtransferase